MKQILFSFLLSSASATSLRRLVEDNADIMSAFDDVDVMCIMSQAADVESCSSSTDMNGDPCVWCPIGNEGLGGCVSADIANTVNAFEIPHFQCGTELTKADSDFYSELEDCLQGGISGTDCVGVVGCTWCVTEEPTFGLCFSQDFVDEAKAFDDPETDPDEMWESTFSCTQDDSATDLMGAGALADLKCADEGNPDDFTSDVKELCSVTVDSVGNACVTASLFGLMDVCVTATQNSIVDFIVGQVNDMGVDPMSLLGQFGGDGPAFGGDDLGGFGDFGDFNDEELEIFQDFDDEDNEVLAELIDEGAKEDTEDETTGQ